MNDGPSGYRIEQALTAWQSARARLLNDDADLAHDEAALVDLLGPEEGGVDDVLARVLRVAAHAKSMADAAGDRIEDLKARNDRYKRRHESWRGVAFAIMDALGKMKFELPDMTVSVSAGKIGLAVTDEDALPDMYVRTVTTKSPDKALLLAALKQQAQIRETLITEAARAGEAVDETKLPSGIPGAVLSSGLPTLTVRMK